MTQRSRCLLKLVFFACFLSIQVESPVSAKSPLILDTDLALGMRLIGQKHTPSDIDDTFAIVEAIYSPDIQLIGISTVFGNTDIDSVHLATQRLRPYLGKALPKLVDGSIGPADESTFCPPGASDAADFMAEELKGRQHISIAALGPLTNLACLATRHPQAIQKIDKIMLVMGQSPETRLEINHIPVSDFNFTSDPIATEVIIESGIPLVLFPFELTRKSLILRSTLEQKSQKSTLAAHTFREGKAFINMWQTVFREPGIHPWDSAPIAYLRNAFIFKCEHRLLEITEEKPRRLLAKRTATSSPMNHLFCHSFSDKKNQRRFEENTVAFL